MAEVTCPMDESVDPCAVCGARLYGDACRIDTLLGWKHRAEVAESEVDRLRASMWPRQETVIAERDQAWAERDALVAIARWAKEAPHHGRCGVIRAGVRHCTCGRDDALAAVDLGDDT